MNTATETGSGSNIITYEWKYNGEIVTGKLESSCTVTGTDGTSNTTIIFP